MTRCWSQHGNVTAEDMIPAYHEMMTPQKYKIMESRNHGITEVWPCYPTAKRFALAAGARTYHVQAVRSDVQMSQGLAPKYLSELLQPVADLESRQRLRSSSKLVVPCMRWSTIGDRAFIVAALRAWNSLPDSLHRLSSLKQFKKLLKTHLFKISFVQQDSLWL